MEHFDPTYLVTLDEIYHAHWAARRRRRIAQLRRAIEELWPQGHPTKFMQITGTNGKGSVSTYLAQAIRERTTIGTWTGPHVFDYAERIHINGKKADHQDIVNVFRERVQPLQDCYTERENSFTFAELGILTALCLFDEKNISWAVMEVGNGGRYTPLMALAVKACILTNVGDDHPKSLGRELWQRALEKAGIARPNIPFFTSATGPARKYVTLAAEAEGAPVHLIREADAAAVAAMTEDTKAPHVYINQALAVAVVQHFFPEANTADLLAHMDERLPARFWQKEPGVVVDVAHNANKIDHLVRELKVVHPNQKFHFVLGLSRSRKPREVFAPLLPIAESLTITAASHAGQDPHIVAEEIREIFPPTFVEPDPQKAYTQTRQRANGAVVVVTGSAYMIDQALNPNPYIRETNATYGRRYHQEGPPV